MTLATFSIADAVSILDKRWQQKKYSSTHKIAGPTEGTGLAADSIGSTTSPVDVVAVVMSVATLQSPPGSLVAKSPRVDIRIADQSVPSNTLTVVSLYGTSEVALVAEQDISPGDVIRFNRLGLSRKYRNLRIGSKGARTLEPAVAGVRRGRTPRAPRVSTQENDPHEDGEEEKVIEYVSLTNNTPIYFEHPIDDPEPGLRWYKLGSILPTQEGEATITKNGVSPPERGQRGPGAIFSRSEYDQTSRGRLPEEMNTAETRIQELVAWYASRYEEGGTRSLSPLPCRRRSLAEIQASPGVISNIHVRVTHCDSQTLPSHLARYSGSKGEGRRNQSTISAAAQPKHVIGFATVTDESGATITLVDPGNRFGSILRMAHQNQEEILVMSNVSSSKQSDIYGQLLRTEEVVLWPSPRTTVSLILSTTSKSDGDVKAKPARPYPSGTTKLRTKNRSAVVEGKQETQSSEELPWTSQGIEYQQSLKQQVVMLKSFIVDIFVNEESIRDCIVDGTPSDLRASLLSVDGADYMPAMVRLETYEVLEQISLVGDEGREKALTTSVFYAASGIVQTLCGSVKPSEWDAATGAGDSDAPNEELPSATTGIGWNALRVLRSLLLEDVHLHWTIDMAREPIPEVIRVTVPKI